MSFIHYLFLGHFEHDGEVVRFEKRPGDQVYKPVVTRPIDMQAAQTVAREVRGVEVDSTTFPPAWSVWEVDGYLICDKYTREREVVEFVTKLVERTGCGIYDAGAHSEISLSEWLAAVHEYSRPSIPAGPDGDPAAS